MGMDKAARCCCAPACRDPGRGRSRLLPVGSPPFCFAGACSRYITELVGGWTVATSVGLLCLLGRTDGKGARLRRILAVGAGAWTIAGVWLASAEFRGFMRQTEPRAYAAVARVLDTPSWWWIRSRGIEFGPLNLEIQVPPDASGETVLVASGRPQMVDQLLVTPVDANHARLILAENERVTILTSPLEIKGGGFTFASRPRGYPPPEHPYWDSIPAASKAELQTLASITAGTQVFPGRMAHAFDAVSFSPVVLGQGDADPNSPFVVSVVRSPR